MQCRKIETNSAEETFALGEQIGRQALHAWKLAFVHPISKAPLAFEAPLPEDMKAVLNLF